MNEAEFRERLGGRLKELRLAKGYSQQQLAAVCEMDKENISRLESGRHSPNSYTLYMIANALGITLSELFANMD
jgi:transcriptional regulator with XRE-family HTH domain